MTVTLPHSVGLKEIDKFHGKLYLVQHTNTIYISSLSVSSFLWFYILLTHFQFKLFYFSDENPSFKDIQDQIPTHESLKDLIERIQPFWQSTIVPTIRDGQRVLIVAHGTSLRDILSLRMYVFFSTW